MTADARRWAGRIGRVGYTARAAVYCLVGAIALDAARRYDPHEPRGIIGALHKLADRPGGRVLLALLAAGLLAQVVWRGVQALTDIERPHGHPPHWWTRFGWSCIGIFYATLFVRAVEFVFHHHGDGGVHKRSLVKRALEHGLGRAIVFGIGVGLVGRGLIFGAGGVLLLRSAFSERADTIGTGDVLRHLVAGPFGPPLVAAIAIGLFAYAVLMIFEAAWRRNVRV